MAYTDAKKIEELLGLDRRLLGISLLRARRHPASAGRLRFCEALIQASGGEGLVFSGSGALCSASDVALGISEPKYAHIEPKVKGKTSQIIMGPLSRWPFKEPPQLVMVVCDPRQAMQVSLALGSELDHIDGEIAVCGLTAYTVSNKKPSLSLLCNSCRLYAGVKGNELALSFPFVKLNEVASNLGKMGGIPRTKVRDLKLTPSARLVFKILKERGRSGQRELVSTSGLSERAVRNALNQLKRKKLIREKPDFSDMRRRMYELG